MMNATIPVRHLGPWDVWRAPSLRLFSPLALLSLFLRRRRSPAQRARLLGVPWRALGQQFGTGLGPRFGQQLLLLRPTFQCPRFTTTGPVTDLLLAQAAQQLLHAPDAVNRDYIGKIPLRKELFCAHKPRDIN